MSGPAPKPTALRLLQGNPGKRPINRAEPQPRADAGYAPRHLGRLAKAEWRRVVPELQRLGLLSIIDRAALEGYCSEYVLYRQCEDILQREGVIFMTETGYMQQRPEVAIRAKALASMRQFMAQFGMTPASRSRVSVQQPEGESEFEQFLKAGGQR